MNQISSLTFNLYLKNIIIRKLILQEWLSLDGFAADVNGGMDYFISPELSIGSDDDILTFMDDIDTILLGADTYKLFVEYWPQATTDNEVIADKLNSTPKLIFSNSLEKAPWGDWPEATVMAGDAIEIIRKLKTEQGQNMVMWGSISLAQSLMAENLIDEYHLRICPTMLTAGRPLFNVPKDLKLIRSKQYDSGLMLVEYVPA